MNYTSLKTNIQDICETSFTDDQLALFVQQAEQRIYNTVHIPAMRNVDSSSLTAGDELYTTPDGYLYTYSLAIVNNDTQTFLLNKDVNFLREAYPNASVEGEPKYYALFDDDTFMLAPTPTSGYTTELHYFYSPPSITEVAGGETWLGTNAPECLLYGSMVQANLFLKGEPDMQQLYEGQYQEALARLRNESAGKSMQDSYRYGQPRQAVE
mgnify:CR=1 FL=1